MYLKFITVLLFAITSCKGVSQNKEEKKETFKVSKSDSEWKKELTDMQYYILRQAGTEPAGTSKLLNNKEEGVYACVACNTPLFKSKDKFNSGTGWPSFDSEITGNVAFDVDYKIGYERTEEHCATCGGHLGHVFSDGPKNTTGKRHCINGEALKFIPKK